MKALLYLFLLVFKSEKSCQSSIRLGGGLCEQSGLSHSHFPWLMEQWLAGTQLDPSRDPLNFNQDPCSSWKWVFKDHSAGPVEGRWACREILNRLKSAVGLKINPGWLEIQIRREMGEMQIHMRSWSMVYGCAIGPEVTIPNLISSRLPQSSAHRLPPIVHYGNVTFLFLCLKVQMYSEMLLQQLNLI